MSFAFAFASRAALVAALLVPTLSAAPAEAQPSGPPPVAGQPPGGEPPLPPPPIPPPPGPAPVLAPAPLAAPAPGGEPAVDDGVRWRYDKGFIAASADQRFELKLGLRTQTRFEALWRDATDEFENRFFLPRVRLQLEGFAYGKANGYKLEYDAGNQGFSAIKDLFVERAFSPGVRLRAGQWKKPFSRQELTSDFALAFAERHASGAFAGAGRDIGVALHSGYEKSPDGVEWAFGVFNGTGERSTISLTCRDGDGDPATPPDVASDCKGGQPSNVPADLAPEVVARVGFNYGGDEGIKGYSELDLEGGPLRFGAAVAYRAKIVEADSDALEQAGEVDVVLKAEGFDLNAALFISKKGTADHQIGGYAQAGVLAVPKRLAIVARAGVTPQADNDYTRLEVLGGVNLLAEGHSYKLVLDGGVVHDSRTGYDDLFGRAQAQFVF